MQCGIPRAGIGPLIQRFPMVLLCKPFGANDRFWRNAVSLCAFAHLHGHCNVPEGEREWRTLARFVSRLRILHAEGRLEHEKIDILTNFQFDFGSAVCPLRLPPASLRCSAHGHPCMGAPPPVRTYVRILRQTLTAWCATTAGASYPLNRLPRKSLLPAHRVEPRRANGAPTLSRAGARCGATTQAARTGTAGAGQVINRAVHRASSACMLG